MIFASKMPSLRIDQSDLKCKNGCDYFGNPQWQGYCSKCHREQLQRQRRAEKASSATLPKPEQKKPERGIKLASHSSFSKFEEKRLRQSETLKKANLLKFSVFKKSNTEEHDHTPERKPPEFKIPAVINEGMKREFRVRFSNLPPQVDRDARVFVHSFIMDVIKCSNVMTVDELSERVQRHYQHFMKYMDTSPHFANAESEIKELLIDFVEKHAMTYLHDLPGVVFSPIGTEDERLDRAMSERIQQLSWVGEKHLECKLDRTDSACSQLLYKAISELLAVDGAAGPGGKLSRVRRACRHVLALCGPTASADDLLPALIFTVLKANPPRLVSNINFVTRFCNAQRLMTGEGGYYFTNLCCAVSFIENLTAESLNMDKKEFDCYMAMPASIGGSAWKEIAFKVTDVLANTPLEIRPRREPPRLSALRNSGIPLIDLETPVDTPAPNKPSEDIPQIKVPEIMPVEEPVAVAFDKTTDGDVTQNVIDFQSPEKPSPPKSPQNQPWELKQVGSFELLTPSPLGFTTFDSRSIDELITPDEFGSDHLAPGLSNINYDIDLSDFSGDNSLAEDTPKEPKDPFSPDGIKKEPIFDPFQPQTSQSSYKNVLEKFDEFSLVDSKSNETSEAFEVVHRTQDSFTPLVKEPGDPFSPMQKESFILDDTSSPTSACLLPSPLQPQTSKPL
ncbi:rab5 GDP/GTP exchange factor isoform X3 [Nymphalis io]|uniref:rab5 GDP/GTP exchange factor isoform X3 n=1 Tax=Inachis io TaxID=171585 RepID=UPI002168CBD2|nr:rab5 GDP/GTP exchange factor isoform X3 [Nymphalis io]